MKLLSPRDPMGIYQILFAFAKETGSYLGDPGTRPLSQGFPLTTRVPGGPELPSSLPVTHLDRMYPKPDGTPALKKAIADYYNRHYGCRLTTDNVMLVAGGRAGLVTLLWMMQQDLRVTLEETEYTSYWDMLRQCSRDFVVVDSNEQNRFRPTLDDHRKAHQKAGDNARQLLLRSNPGNPTGVTLQPSDLDKLAKWTTEPGFAALVDEAYEFFTEPPTSVLAHVEDLDAHNLFVVGAATKGLQSPGARTGWVIGPAKELQTLKNFSSYAMGGVSQLSQNYVLQLFQPAHIDAARNAIATFYGSQRRRYCEALQSLGFVDHTGTGGFYCWMKLPDGLTAVEFNRRLFRQKAAILPGELFDMRRRGEQSPLRHFLRVSFGSRNVEDFDGDIAVMQAALRG